jgi:hypothetical protein
VSSDTGIQSGYVLSILSNTARNALLFESVSLFDSSIRPSVLFQLGIRDGSRLAFPSFSSCFRFPFSAYLLQDECYYRFLLL